jgi:hypothetical protein
VLYSGYLLAYVRSRVRTCSGTASTAAFRVPCSPRCRAMFTARPYSCSGGRDSGNVCVSVRTCKSEDSVCCLCAYAGCECCAVSVCAAEYVYRIL